MNAVRKKLKSKSGISLAIALVFFLLCAMVGMVVMSDASTSAGSTAWERQLYRETLALTSASELLRQDIQDMTFTGAYIKTETVTTTVTPAVAPDGEPSTTVTTSETYKLKAPELEGSRFFEVEETAGKYSDTLGLTQIYIMKNGDKLESGFSVTLPEAVDIKFDAVEDQHIPEVTGSIQAEEDYSLFVELQCGENRLTMSFPPQVASSTEIVGPNTISLGENTTVRTTETTYSTILTWGQPRIKEGGGDDA